MSSVVVGAVEVSSTPSAALRVVVTRYFLKTVSPSGQIQRAKLVKREAKGSVVWRASTESATRRWALSNEEAVYLLAESEIERTQMREWPKLVPPPVVKVPRPPAELPAFTLKLSGRWRGREVRVFKKSLEAAASWYICPEFRGRRFKSCLGTAQRGAAEIKAAELIDLIWSDPWEEWERRRPRFGAVVPRAEVVALPATWGKVFAAYRKVAGVHNGVLSISGNIKAARLIVREAAGQPEAGNDVVDSWVCAPSGLMLSEFQRRRLAAVGRADFAARQRALRTVHANVRFMRSIFKEEWRRQMVRSEGLFLPDLKEFMEEWLERPKKVKKVAPSRELLVKTFEAAKVLHMEEPAVYIAWLLSLYSLRRGEIQRMRRDWLQEEALQNFADAAAPEVKGWVLTIPDEVNRKRGGRVPLPSWVAGQVIEFWERDHPAREEWDRKFILPSPWHGQGQPGAVDRAQRITERASEWMRELGWETAHTLHEMRAHFLRVVEATYGLEMARELGRHQSATTTKDNYTGDKGLSGVVVQFPLGHHEEKSEVGGQRSEVGEERERMKAEG